MTSTRWLRTVTVDCLSPLHHPFSFKITEGDIFMLHKMCLCFAKFRAATMKTKDCWRGYYLRWVSIVVIMFFFTSWHIATQLLWRLWSFPLMESDRWWVGFWLHHELMTHTFSLPSNPLLILEIWSSSVCLSLDPCGVLGHCYCLQTSTFSPITEVWTG